MKKLFVIFSIFLSWIFLSGFSTIIFETDYCNLFTVEHVLAISHSPNYIKICDRNFRRIPDIISNTNTIIFFGDNIVTTHYKLIPPGSRISRLRCDLNYYLARDYDLSKYIIWFESYDFSKLEKFIDMLDYRFDNIYVLYLTREDRCLYERVVEALNKTKFHSFTSNVLSFPGETYAFVRRAKSYHYVLAIVSSDNPEVFKILSKSLNIITVAMNKNICKSDLAHICVDLGYNTSFKIRPIKTDAGTHYEVVSSSLFINHKLLDEIRVLDINRLLPLIEEIY